MLPVCLIGGTEEFLCHNALDQALHFEKNIDLRLSLPLLKCLLSKHHNILVIALDLLLVEDCLHQMAFRAMLLSIQFEQILLREPSDRRVSEDLLQWEWGRPDLKEFGMSQDTQVESRSKREDIGRITMGECHNISIPCLQMAQG